MELPSTFARLRSIAVGLCRPLELLMRVMGLLQTFNEEQFIAGCLEHYIGQGVEVYLVDNCSTDRTVAIAERYLGRGLVAIEALPRLGVFSLRAQLERKERLSTALEADWFVHIDADEIRVPPPWALTLADAFAQVEAQGYNAVNFMEFTFIPTRQAPDHEHSGFQQTMRWYYPFLPFSLHRLNAWKKQPEMVKLAWSAGHQVDFPGLCMCPESFPLRHYLFLSVAHALRKFVAKRYDPAEVKDGWHRGRADLTAEMIELPDQAELRVYTVDEELDASAPRTRHHLGTQR